MCITDHYDTTLAVKVALNLNTKTNLKLTIHRAVNTIKGDNSKYIFFFQNYAPFSTWTFYPVSSTPQPNFGI